MEIVHAHGRQAPRPKAIPQLAKSLLLPLLAVGFIFVAFVAVLLVAGTTQLSLWVVDTEVELQQRIETIDVGAPLRVRPAGTETSPAPAGCAGRGRELEMESGEVNAGPALLDALAARGVVPCGGLVSKSEVTPPGTSALARQLVGWQQLLVLLCGALIVSRIQMAYGPRPEPGTLLRHALNIFIGVLGAFGVQACAWLTAFVAAAEVPLPFADVASELPLAFMASISLIVPLMEETAFRAWLIPIAGKVLGPAAVVAFSSVSFALFHGTLDGLHLAFYAAAGLVFSLVWMRTRSLLACVVAHAGYNSWVTLQLLLA